MMFQVYGIHSAFGPFKRERSFVTDISKGIYSPADVSDRGGIETAERLAGKDAEPNLDLVEPRSMGRNVVEMNGRVSRQPAAMFSRVLKKSLKIADFVR